MSGGDDWLNELFQKIYALATFNNTEQIKIKKWIQSAF